MNHLIIYHPDKNEFIKATNFEHISIDHEEAFTKLDEIVMQHPDLPIVFRINFENIPNQHSQKKIYSLPFLDIFIIREYLTIKNVPASLLKFNLYALNPLVKKNESLSHIATIKKRIQHGYFYQVNYSIPFQGKTDSQLDTWELFSSLRDNFKGDLHALLPLKDNLHLLSFSPELFLKKEDKKILSEPIKGTAKLNEKEKLLNSTKENAELSMIVDLLRNDLNAVCNSPVKVNFHRKILELKHLLHTFSQIEGESNLSVGKIFKSMLPGGSISGCPKKESIHSIYELEPFAREHYTGILGIIMNNQMRASVVIRSLLYDKSTGEFTYNAGSGIVYDSNPEDEVDEIYLKSKSLINNPSWINSTTNTTEVILFTTLLLDNEGLKDLDLHVERLFKSLRYLKKEINLSPKELMEKALKAALALYQGKPLRFKISIKSGSINFEWQELIPYPDLFILGFCQKLVIDSKNLNLNHKLNQYEKQYQALKSTPNYDDLIFVNENGNVTETTKANIFFIDRNNLKLITPPITDGLLPGIERQKILTQKSLILAGVNYVVEEKSLSLEEVKAKYNEVIITNSLMGIRHGKIKF